MTIEKLMQKLSQYDPQTEVYLGKYQRFGSNFIYDIKTIEEKTLEVWWENKRKKAVILIEDEQMGTITDEQDEAEDIAERMRDNDWEYDDCLRLCQLAEIEDEFLEAVKAENDADPDPDHTSDHVVLEAAEILCVDILS